MVLRNTVGNDYFRPIRHSGGHQSGVSFPSSLPGLTPRRLSYSENWMLHELIQTEKRDERTEKFILNALYFILWISKCL